MHGKTYQNILTLDNTHLPLITMDDAGGVPSPYYDDLLMHPFRDEVTESLNLRNRAERIEIPILSIAGWYDVFLKTTIDDWAVQREKNADTGAAGKQWILISPGDHESSTEHTNKIGRLDIGDKSANTRWEMRQEFYDHFLKGIDNGFEKTPPVSIFVIGDNDWRHEDQWPPEGVEYKEYYFHSGGSANTLNGDGELGPKTSETTEDKNPDTYIYDPASPVDIATETDMWLMAAQLKDRTQVEERDDVLVYTSPALEEDMEVTGPISVTLYAASSAVDTDFTAALIDVFPDGYTHLIQEGIQRARYREGDAGPTFLTPDKIYKYNIDLWATSHVIKAGHRIRVEISSSNFDRFDRNLNTGNEFGTSSEMVIATQTIYHTSEYPSHITLPIIPR
jgi:hypothetical protein